MQYISISYLTLKTLKHYKKSGINNHYQTTTQNSRVWAEFPIQPTLQTSSTMQTLLSICLHKKSLFRLLEILSLDFQGLERLLQCESLSLFIQLWCLIPAFECVQIQVLFTVPKAFGVGCECGKLQLQFCLKRVSVKLKDKMHRKLTLLASSSLRVFLWSLGFNLSLS